MFDIDSILKSLGYAGVFGIIFAESGLLIGFFLPGDSLLFAAGLLASRGYFNIVILCLGSFAAAVIGDNVGYHFGKKVGPKVFTKNKSLIFSKENVVRSQAFYNKHGGKTIILARFFPVIRTFAPVVAGVGKMEYKKFFIYNVIGGLLWAVGVTLLGFFVGNIVPDIDKYLLPGIILIIFLSVIPGLWHVLRDPSSRARYATHIKHATSKIKSRKTK